MTTQKSSNKAFWYAFKSSFPSAVIPAVINMFVILFASTFTTFSNYQDELYMLKSNAMEAGVAPGELKDTIGFMFFGDVYNIGISTIMILMSVIGCSLFMGILLLGFIANKKMVNVYYSLGIKREQLFLAKIIPGILMMLVSIVLPMLATAFVNVYFVGSNPYMWKSIIFLICGLFVTAIAAMTITACVFSCVGSRGEGAFFSFIILIAPSTLMNSLDSLAYSFLDGYAGGGGTLILENGIKTISGLPSKFSILSPVNFFVDDMQAYAGMSAKKGVMNSLYYSQSVTKNMPQWSNPSYLRVIVWFAVSIAILALGVFLFKRRKAEISGFMGKNNVLNFVVAFTISFGMFSLLSVSINTESDFPWGVVIGAIVVVAVWALIIGILTKDKKLMKKDMVKLPIYVGVPLFIVVFCSTGMFGAYNRVPSVEKIEGVKISTVSADPYLTENSTMRYEFFDVLSGEGEIVLGDFTDENDKKLITDIHSDIINGSKKVDESDKMLSSVAVNLIYTLSSGKEIVRVYYIDDMAVVKKMLLLEETKYYNEKLRDVITGKFVVDKEYFVKTYFGTYTFNYGIYDADFTNLYAASKDYSAVEELDSFTKEQHDQLRKVLADDLCRQTVKQRYYPDDVEGFLVFEPDSEKIYDESQKWYKEFGSQLEGEYPIEDLYNFGGYDTVTETNVEQELLEEDDYDYYDWEPLTYNTTKIPITADMKDTIAYLKTLGVYDKFTTENKLPKSIRVYNAKYSKNSYMSAGSNYFVASIGLYQRATDSEYYSDDVRWELENKVTDVKQIGELMKLGKVTQYTNDEGYYLALEMDKDVYRTTFIRQEDAPAYLKEYAKNANLSEAYWYY